MAKVKSFEEESRKRKKNAAERQKESDREYARHKTLRLIRILLILAILIGAAVYFYVRYRGKIYVGYDVISSVERTKVDGAKDVKFGNSILT